MRPRPRDPPSPGAPPRAPAAGWLAALGLQPFALPLRPPLDLPALLAAALPGLEGAALLAAALDVEQHLFGLSPAVDLEWTMTTHPPRTYRARAAAHTSPDGATTLRGVVEDISATADARAAQQSALTQLQAVLDCLPDAVFVVRAGRVAAANPRARALANVPLPDGEPVLALVEPSARPALAAALRQPGGPSFTAPSARTPGAVLELTTAQAPGLGAEEVLLTVRDVTARQLADQRVALSERLATVGRLAAGVAHEVNNPLSFVTLNLETLEAELPALLDGLAAAGPDPAALAAIQEALADALVGTRRVSEIVGQLRRFAHHRPDAGPTSADAREGITLACQLARHALPPGVRAHMELAPGLPPIPLDPGRLSQILINLLVNAGDAIASAGRQSGAVTIQATAVGDEVEISVTDDGPGIPPALAARIFERFFTTKDAGKGSGLGLSIVRTLVEEGRGTLSLRPGGPGACFVLRFPRADLRATAPAPASRAGLPTLLLVDDEPALLRALSARLRHEWEVVTAPDGAAARARIADGLRPAAILCDIMMPGLDGRGLLAWLQDAHPALAARVVFMTAGALGEDRQALLGPGGNPVVSKPIDLPQLQAALRARGAAPAPSGAERRRAPRFAAAPVTAWLDLGSAVHKASLVDVSRTGLRLRNGAIAADALRTSPARLLLRAEEGGQLAEVRVAHVWSRPADPTPDPGSIDHAFTATDPLGPALLDWLAAGPAR